MEILAILAVGGENEDTAPSSAAAVSLPRMVPMPREEDEISSDGDDATSGIVPTGSTRLLAVSALPSPISGAFPALVFYVHILFPLNLM